MQLQVFLPGDPDLPALTAEIPLGNWHTVELHVPVAAVSGRIRIRPVDRPCVVEVSAISVAVDVGNVLWRADTAPDLRKLETEGSIMILPEKGRCVFFSFGATPLWVLPRFKLPDGFQTLKITLCIAEDFAAVSKAVQVAHKEIYLMAAQVRSAFTERHKTLREIGEKFEGRAEKAEAERDSALLKVQEQAQELQEQTQGLQEQAQELQEQAQELQEQAKKIMELQAENQALLAQAEELKKIRTDYGELHRQLGELHRQFLEVQQSRSWRVTRPLRSASTLAQKLKKSFD